MKIIKAFKTSRGIYANFDDASKKANRYRDTDPRSPCFGAYESVQEVFVLQHITDQGIAYFELKHIAVS